MFFQFFNKLIKLKNDSKFRLKSDLNMIAKIYLFLKNSKFFNWNNFILNIVIAFNFFPQIKKSLNNINDFESNS
ncbi:hypothetical protein BpHYR1_041119 [Brachionus plicatilis]|uniref:Uncharacterized protein n=1 Tax=Brachionus plicatilis TaxID=10195 RepID=A0A3M7S456_BRAPC|nr:hypothetical protein BpHYR1_041119 [Brachionus plicatilis]